MQQLMIVSAPSDQNSGVAHDVAPDELLDHHRIPMLHCFHDVVSATCEVDVHLVVVRVDQPTDDLGKWPLHLIIQDPRSSDQTGMDDRLKLVPARLTHSRPLEIESPVIIDSHKLSRVGSNPIPVLVCCGGEELVTGLRETHDIAVDVKLGGGSQFLGLETLIEI